MNYSIVLYILGCVLKFESAFLVLPALVGLIYREHASVSYLAVAVLCLILGVLLTHKKPRSTNLYTREGFVAVALSWIIMSIFGAIPFVLTGDIPFYVDALFETISGFTTTGLSTNCSAAPRIAFSSPSHRDFSSMPCSSIVNTSGYFESVLTRISLSSPNFSAILFR